MRVTIERLVYGGAGLARTDQGVVFVPHTAPGDIVEIDFVERKADYSTGRVTTLLEPSPDRQTPYCPNYATAGCCHWQHIRYPRQLEIKEGIVRETLRRAGRILWEEPIRVVSGPDRNYRLRASFHVRDHRLGFVEEGGHTVVPISECAALTPELNAFIPEGNKVLGSAEMGHVREVHAISGPPVLAVFGRKRVGRGPVRISVNEFVFDLDPEAFFQSNRHLLGDFIHEVTAAASGSQHILDLFCGSGFFTIPLARAAQEVLGVEWSRAALRQGKLNAKLNNVSNIEFFEGHVEDTLRKSSALRPDLVVMNPPRAGCGRDVAGQIARLKASRLLYVSCNPSTFAREVSVFVAEGYTLKQIVLIDQFPNTYHIEMTAVFEK